MFTVVQRLSLASDISLLEVFAPGIATTILPGQFVMVRSTAHSREVVLPVCGWNRELKTVSVLVHVVDAATEMLAHNQEISVFAEMKGPLGQPSELTECNDRELKQSKIIFVVEGCAVATALSQMKWLHLKGCITDVVVSAKSKNKLLLLSELEKVSQNNYLATDDGSVGFHGPVAQLLEILLNKDEHGYNLVVAVGSLSMMKAVTTTTQGHGILTIANFTHLLTYNNIQSNGFRLNVAGALKDVALDGPEFNASSVNFEQAQSRISISLKLHCVNNDSSDISPKIKSMISDISDLPIDKQA